MKIEFLSKHYVLKDYMKDMVAKKIEKLDKFFEDDTTIKVLFKHANEVFTLELTIIDDIVMRSEVSSDDMAKNIDIALPKLEKQIIKHRKKLLSKSKKMRLKDESSFAPFVQSQPEEKKSGVVRKKNYELVPMTVEDAIEELELVGHSFYMFFNKSTRKVNVLYTRADGDYGLIVGEYPQ
ncbi:MAG: ribosome-associated translation inhibitor RaiA [Firmicutes bacterium]|nr:ribosome-associated translation inhibitor RaiA [Bacillota bacterium]MCL2256148.1 ribosome-associated translation inhibitor RaiA [Bacillota bacterium]